jgi:preprotein translocase subunit SecF
MSEQLNDHETHEQNSDDIEVAPKDTEKLLEATTEGTEQETHNVEAIRENVEQAEAAVTPVELETDKPKEDVELPPPNKTLKAQALNQTLKQTRQKMSKPQKAFSKVIHQPQVDAISNITGKTIARPSGLFFGGFFALIGSVLYLFLSHHYHFTYKYIAFSLFFIGGFIIGLIVEFLGKMFKRSKV